MKKARLNTLTPREKEIFNHLVDGKTNSEIAKIVDGICVKTVKFHLTHIYKKLGQKDRLKCVVSWYKGMIV